MAATGLRATHTHTHTPCASPPRNHLHFRAQSVFTAVPLSEPSQIGLQIPFLQSCFAMATVILMENEDDCNPEAAAAAAMEMVTFSAIIDDIIFPDGRNSIACLGGGGSCFEFCGRGGSRTVNPNSKPSIDRFLSRPQTAFGALLWFSNGERVGLAGGVGADDFPDSCKAWLEKAGVDTSGLLLWPLPTLRVWHLSEPLDGSIQSLEDDRIRGEIQKLSGVDPSWEMLLPELNLLPPVYQQAKTFHIAVHPSGVDIDFLRTLRSGAEILSVEVFSHAEEAVPHSELMALVSTGHIFSPNEREAVSLVGAGTPLELVGRLSELGAEIVVLRRGHRGSIVHRSDTKETWDVAAFHTLVDVEGREMNNHGDGMHMTELQKASLKGMNVKAIVDPTGCGNAFCGGFLIGWYKTRNLLTAALWGSVSASFMLEYEGLPPPLVSEWRAVAQLRLDLLQPHAKRIPFPEGPIISLGTVD